MIKKFLALFFLLSTLLFTVPHVLAVDANPCATRGTTNFEKLCDLNASSDMGKIVRNLIIAIFVIATLIALFFLVWGGVRWIVSGGDKAKVEAARETIVAAIIGLIIVFLAYFVLSIVLNIFGLSLSDLQIPSITDSAVSGPPAAAANQTGCRPC